MIRLLRRIKSCLMIVTNVTVLFAIIFVTQKQAKISKMQKILMNSEFHHNTTWSTLRSELLGKEVVSKVVILAYARGGSTFVSDVFNIEPNHTILWYEALDSFYSFYSGLSNLLVDTTHLYFANLTRKSLDSAALEALTEFFVQLMTCDFEKVPVELLAIEPYIQKASSLQFLSQCLAKHNLFSKHTKCQSLLESHCQCDERIPEIVSSARELAASMKCSNLLKILRHWEPNTGDKNTLARLLQKYMSEYSTDELNGTVYGNCLNFLRLGVTGRKGITPASNENCTQLEGKLKLFVDHHTCVKTLSKEVHPCRMQLEKPCEATRLITVKVLRVFLKDLEPLIRRMPEIHIVHYVRDPRAVSVSRFEKRYHIFKKDSPWTIVDEVRLLCARMRYDTEEKGRLLRTYPGSIITVRYEDLVVNPVATVTRMYEYFGRPVPNDLGKWVERTMKAKADNGLYGVHRANATRHLTDWRSKVYTSDTDAMNGHCRDVLLEYGYSF